jgi:hypothetical protein
MPCINSAVMPGSSKVLVSPSCSVSPSAIFRKILRIILPCSLCVNDRYLTQIIARKASSPAFEGSARGALLSSSDQPGEELNPKKK